MKKCKVMHLLKSNKYSGAENVVCQIIEQFMNDDMFEMVYCSPGGEITNTLNNRGIKNIVLEDFSSKHIKKAISEYSPDIIHAHDYSAGLVCSGIKGIAVVNHLHNNPPWIKKYGIKSFAYFMASRKIKKILSVSDSIVNEYVFGSKIAEKTENIGNPVNIKKILEKSQKNDFSKHYDVAFLGRLSLPKNPLKFIKIISKLKVLVPNIQAIMIGDGEMMDECKILIDKLGLKENIFLNGFSNKPFSILKNCRSMCMPSSWEGFGLAAVEALALGVPVAAGNVGGLPGIITEECGLLSNTDDDYVKELAKLITDDEYHGKKSIEAYKRACALDNIDDYTLKIKNVYKQILKGK